MCITSTALGAIIDRAETILWLAFYYNYKYKYSSVFQTEIFIWLYWSYKLGSFSRILDKFSVILITFRLYMFYWNVFTKAKPNLTRFFANYFSPWGAIVCLAWSTRWNTSSVEWFTEKSWQTVEWIDKLSYWYQSIISPFYISALASAPGLLRDRGP